MITTTLRKLAGGGALATDTETSGSSLLLSRESSPAPERSRPHYRAWSSRQGPGCAPVAGNRGHRHTVTSKSPRETHCAGGTPARVVAVQHPSPWAGRTASSEAHSAVFTILQVLGKLGPEQAVWTSAARHPSSRVPTPHAWGPSGARGPLPPRPTRGLTSLPLLPSRRRRGGGGGRAISHKSGHVPGPALPCLAPHGSGRSCRAPGLAPD